MSRPADCALLHTKAHHFQTNTKIFRSAVTWHSVSTQSSADISWPLTDRNFRKRLSSDVALYPTGKEASHIPLGISKQLQNLRHLKIHNCPLRLKPKQVLLSIGSWSVRKSGGWRPALTEVLEIVLRSMWKILEMWIQIDHDGHNFF